MIKDIRDVDVEVKKLKKQIELLNNENRLELLVKEVKKLLSIVPEDKDGLYMLARAYKNLNKIDEAEKVILKYLKRYEDNACGHVLYAHILEKYNKILFNAFYYISNSAAF